MVTESTFLQLAGACDSEKPPPSSYKKFACGLEHYFLVLYDSIQSETATKTELD